MPRIDIKDVSYCYRDNDEVFLALEDINLEIRDGEFICLVGHSGCGKSTLLSLLAGLALPDVGTIEVDGVPILGPSIKRAMVFQHYSLFPWMKVAKNVAFSVRKACPELSKEKAMERARKYLAEVGMAEAADKYPFQLSGGMQQRVAIARALAMESDILLLDEPFGALDARNRQELQDLLMELWQNAEHRKTVVFVTHDLNEALLLADRIVFMRPKHIERVVDVYFKRPRNLDELSTCPQFRELRNELLGLFYLDGAEGTDSSTRKGKDKIQKMLDGPSDDDAEGIFHYGDIQGGCMMIHKDKAISKFETVDAAVAAEEKKLHLHHVMIVVMCLLAHIVFVAVVITVFLPGKRTPPTIIPFLVTIALSEAFYLWRFFRKGSNKIAISWIALIWWGVLLAWEIVSTKLGCVSPVLFPTPESVFNVFPTQWPALLENFRSSMGLLAMGAVTSIIAGVILGAICGWIEALRNVCAPIARVLSPIPSVVFAPYIVALMPTFRIASATVIFLGVFWPCFLNTIIRVNGIDRRIIESARMLELSSFEMVKDIILPYLIPGVVNGLNGQLTASITMLTFAEMLGSKSGMGYYIINYTNFANYVNVIAGIIMVGVVVTILNCLINLLRKHAVKWR